MGFGGETTLLGCKAGVMNRIPASFFVSVAYNCWAFRRLGVRLDPQTGSIDEWFYQEGEKLDLTQGTEAELETAAAKEDGQQCRRTRSANNRRENP